MKTIQVGSVEIPGQVLLAPMAGFTDLPYRKICRQWGAAYAVAEMTASKESLQKTAKTEFRMILDGEPNPRGIQLIGADPVEVGKAALRVEQAGAQIVDLNCGCPARKVCSVACGSALLRQPEVIKKLLESMVASVDIPVTLKFRTGWDENSINALDIGRIAEDAGVSMLVLHGRTRVQGFKGQAEYETARKLKQSVSCPVVVNGDIDSAEKAKAVMEYTGADGIMVGRAAFGNPWIFKEINDALCGNPSRSIPPTEIHDTIVNHIKSHLEFYGEARGLKTIRKHLSQYLKRFSADEKEIQRIFLAENLQEQIDLTKELLSRLDLSVVSLKGVNF